MPSLDITKNIKLEKIMRDDYILEKTVLVIKEQARLLKFLQNEALTSEELINSLKSSAYRSLYDLTKIASDVSESEWETTDRDLIKNDPDNGLEILLKRYGWIKETTLERKKREILDFVELVRNELRDSAPSPNRTLFNEFLYKTPYRGKLVEEISKQLEKVNQCDLTCILFTRQTLNILKGVEEYPEKFINHLQVR
jgi:hypothetical protein